MSLKRQATEATVYFYNSVIILLFAACFVPFLFRAGVFFSEYYYYIYVCLFFLNVFRYNFS